MSLEVKNLKFDERGLIPAIVQDAHTRNELWHKGETSGNTQQVVSLTSDCDNDALVVLVEAAGPACHTGARSCFDVQLDEQHPGGLLHELYALIKRRKEE